MEDELHIIETIIDNKEIIKEIIKDLSEEQKIKIIKNSKNDIETDKNIMEIINTEINKLEQLKNFDINTLFTFIYGKLVKQIQVEIETIIDDNNIINEIIQNLFTEQKIKIIKNSENDIKTDKNIMKIINREINKLEQLKNFDINTLFTFIYDKLVEQIKVEVEVEVEVDLNKGKGKSKGKGKGKGKDKSKGKGKGKDKSKGKGKGISKGKDKGKGQRAKDKGQRQISRQIQ